MKLIYLATGPMGRTEAGQAELARRRAYLQRHAARDTQVDITDIPSGPGSIESLYEEYLSIPETALRAHELQADGWNGILLGCYGDPGLGALREIVDIPVVGAGQATALMASALGRRYSVITVTDSVIGPLEETLRNSGGGDKLASVRAVNIPVLELRNDRELAIEATLGEARKAIAQDRADTLIVGCMSMGFLEIPEACQAELGLPFLNPARVQLKFLEAMLGAGLSHSKRAYMTPPKLAAGLASSPADLLHRQN
ncbi:MAG: aspartate/glutamate racemase family protein [Chloroflexi bacterium]|nr:aspartate/glutamate racemase family protein [Chloroflexota bacterium]MCY4246885.1 aspartate/glutamate racemase family protein [Chloroflexota bacterium]